MKKVFVVLLALVLVLTMLPSMAFAAGETVNITNTAELEAAIANQDSGQTWNIAAGTYDIAPNSTIVAGGQTGWYFPIVKDGITINGAGIGQTIITSSTFTANGNWATQDLMAIFGNSVTVKNLTIQAKLETNKDIEIMGKDVTLQNIVTKNNPGDTDAFGGSVYFNPQNAGKDIGTATLDNVMVTQAWIACGTSSVLAGSLIFKNGTTIDFRGCGYAPYNGYGVISSNPSIIHGSGLTILADNTFYDIQTQLFNRAPAGSVIILSPGTYGAFTIPTGVTVEVPDGVVLGGNIQNNGTLSLASGAIVKGTISGNAAVTSLDQTEVKASVDPTYTIVIPASVNFGTLTKTMPEQSQSFSVAIKDSLINSGATVAVAVASDFSMKDQANAASLAYQLFNVTSGGSALGTGANYCTFTSSQAAAHVDGRVTCLPSALTNAGSYSGNMNFTITYTE